MACKAFDAGGLEACIWIPCPCKGGCTGYLKTDGRNVQNTLTFLECTVCHCTYVAGDILGDNGKDGADGTDG